MFYRAIKVNKKTKIRRYIGNQFYPYNDLFRSNKQENEPAIQQHFSEN